MPDLDPFPQLTAIPKTGALTCGHRFTPNGDPCGWPAAWHVAWQMTATKADLSLVCDACMQAVQRCLVYVDRHPARLECGKPGTGWLTQEPSRCVWVEDDASCGPNWKDRP
ncbi:hypothetical protein [Streptomyces sp. NPDC127040]|uniref:hypothetical protein n=1 Tax=Streptomyces sp. NPDC127040 TaxID=3347116 RepID=UPI003654AA99